MTNNAESKKGIWICPVCKEYTIPEKHELNSIHYCRNCESKLKICYNNNLETKKYYTYSYMVAVAKLVDAQGCGPCVLIRTCEFNPRRSPK